MIKPPNPNVLSGGFARACNHIIMIATLLPTWRCDYKTFGLIFKSKQGSCRRTGFWDHLFMVPVARAWLGNPPGRAQARAHGPAAGRERARQRRRQEGGESPGRARRVPQAGRARPEDRHGGVGGLCAGMLRDSACSCGNMFPVCGPFEAVVRGAGEPERGGPGRPPLEPVCVHAVKPPPSRARKPIYSDLIRFFPIKSAFPDLIRFNPIFSYFFTFNPI